MNFSTALKTRRLFFDGGLGTMLQQAGLPAGTLPDLWNLERPQAVEGVHAAYLAAGCDVVTTNTFGSNAHKLAPYGVPVERVVGAAVANARRAVAATGREAFVALDLGPTGKLLEPYGDLPFEEAISLYAQIVQAGSEAGCDCVLVETMSDVYELKAAVLAAKEHCELPILATVILDEGGKLLTGGGIPAVVALLEGLGVSALGLNCGLGPDQMAPLVAQLARHASIPLMLNPNAGLPREEAGRTVFDISPAEFARQMAPLAAYASILGGCCGTTPEHIKALVQACRPIPAPRPVWKDQLLISSYGGAVAFQGAPVIIGERINPTGKKRLQQALREWDMNYLLREGLAQQEAGAQVLDVNVGVPGLNEEVLLPQVVRQLQSVTALPLQLDTSHPGAMEAALRCYNGKPLINSVNGKEESLAALLPLVKKYGGGLVCLTLDESGIPDTAAGRLAVARRIVERAEAAGIPRRELLVDVLTLPVSAGKENGMVTLEALKLVREELGVKTALGVSNVSFGLPQRERINTAFFTLAMGAGLDGAIINPNNQAMMGAWRSYRALTGQDPQCGDYIAAYSQAPDSTPTAPAGELTLEEAIVKGLSAEAASLARQSAQAGAPALEVINAQLVPALDRVGQGFEAKTLFLPQLLMSAEAAKAAFEALRAFMPPEAEGTSGPKILLATVKGDIHDIGKNIVKVLLENYRFQVVDLGKDVEPQVILDRAVAEDIQLVGLSALMTTTVPYMAETIGLLHDKKPGCKVVVGGAVLTQEYARQIGADCYAKDAMATVHYAQQLFSR